MALRLPVIRGVIARRLLVNFRVKADVLAPLLPAPFRPKLVNGWGMAGVCLIRLENIRPALVPSALGLNSENAAHRVAVEWDEAGARHDGVFIPRRDSDSRLNQLAGGRLFPGVHHPAMFWSAESGNRFKIELRSDDGEVFVRVAARLANGWPGGSVFGSLEEAAAFFKAGGRGWSPRGRNGELEGLELCTAAWRVEPLIVERVEASFFSDARRFPPGAVKFDNALLMRGVPHEWRALGTMQAKERGPCVTRP